MKTPEEILNDFDYVEYDHTEFPYPIMQWQSIRLFPHMHLQIDLLVDDQELEVLKGEKQMIMRDLYRFYYGYPKDCFEVVQRGYVVDIHTAANPYPHHRMFKQTVPYYSVIHTVDNPYNGFYWKILGGKRSNQMAMGIKDTGDGVWHVSFAMFMTFFAN